MQHFANWYIGQGFKNGQSTRYKGNLGSGYGYTSQGYSFGHIGYSGQHSTNSKVGQSTGSQSGLDGKILFGSGVTLHSGF